MDVLTYPCLDAFHSLDEDINMIIDILGVVITLVYNFGTTYPWFLYLHPFVITIHLNGLSEYRAVTDGVPR